MSPATAPTPENPHVSIIVVNFGPGWDTIECLDSVLQLRYPNFRVIVVDNGPGPGSTALIRGWAAGTVVPPAPRRSPLAHRTLAAAPVSFALLRPADIGESLDHRTRVVLIPVGENRGFAAAANFGIAFAEAGGESDYYWLLNNDTVVHPGALDALVGQAAVDPTIGLCGSTLLDYARPGRIQARGGGRYDRWWGRTQLSGEGEPLGSACGRNRRLDFVHGASVLVRRDFAKRIGTLDESYFLYFEDLDWAMRGRTAFRLGYAADSLVWHKDGGAVARPAARSARADFFGIRNRILFTRRFHPIALPTVYVGLLVAMLNRARRRQWARLGMILRLMLRPA